MKKPERVLRSVLAVALLAVWFGQAGSAFAQSGGPTDASATVTLLEGIDSARSQPGHQYRAVLDKPITVSGIPIPKGTPAIVALSRSFAGNIAIWTVQLTGFVVGVAPVAVRGTSPTLPKSFGNVLGAVNSAGHATAAGLRVFLQPEQVVTFALGATPPPTTSPQSQQPNNVGRSPQTGYGPPAGSQGTAPGSAASKPNAGSYAPAEASGVANFANSPGQSQADATTASAAQYKPLPAAQAGDPAGFDVLGVRLGMSGAEVIATLRKRLGNVYIENDKKGDKSVGDLLYHTDTVGDWSGVKLGWNGHFWPDPTLDPRKMFDYITLDIPNGPSIRFEFLPDSPIHPTGRPETLLSIKYQVDSDTIADAQQFQQGLIQHYGTPKVVIENYTPRAPVKVDDINLPPYDGLTALGKLILPKDYWTENSPILNSCVWLPLKDLNKRLNPFSLRDTPGHFVYNECYGVSGDGLIHKNDRQPTPLSKENPVLVWCRTTSAAARNSQSLTGCQFPLMLAAHSKFVLYDMPPYARFAVDEMQWYNSKKTTTKAIY